MLYLIIIDFYSPLAITHGDTKNERYQGQHERKEPDTTTCL